MMGGSCSSSGLGGAAQSVEKRCSRRSKRNSSSTSSSSSSTSSSLATKQADTSSPVAQPTRKPLGYDSKNATAEPALSGAARSSKSPATSAVASVAADAPKGEQQDATKVTSKRSQRDVVAAKEGSTMSMDNEQDMQRKLRLEKLKEGVDFIETEEDAEAVESAVVKIQSTFRGKKIRSKLGQKQPPQQQQAASAPSIGQTNDQQEPATKLGPQKTPASCGTQPELGTNQEGDKKKGKEDDEKQLSSQVANMQVNDNSGDKEASAKQTGANMPNLQEDEADRAATKIQAGFKGYKTRKELEGKMSQPLGAGSGATAGAQEAAQAALKH